MKAKYEKLVAQVEDWVDKGEYMKILETLHDIPREEYDTNLVGILARTYNSLGQYEKAIPLLLSIEEESRDDTNWFYRLGNSYYYTGQIEEAEDCFLRAAELDPDDVDTKEFVYRCRPCFAARVEAFWRWFEANESTLSELCENRETMQDVNKGLAFIEKGASIIGPDAKFNIGGDHEFTFSVHGEDYLFYLYPYLVSRMPGSLKGKWKVYPYNRGHEGANLTFRMYDEDVNFSGVKVKAEYDSDRNAVALTFYHPVFNKLEEKQAYNAFYVMADLALGEAFNYFYVSSVDMADEEQEGMVALTELRQHITKQVEDCGKQIKETPKENYTAYNFDPDTDGEFYNSRYDVMSGTTNYPALVRDYYQADMYRSIRLMDFGAKAAYLGFTYNNREEAQAMLDLRYELQERIEKEIFGESEGRPGKGHVLGGAAGTECMYIDLLLFDEKDFIRRMRELVKDYPVNMFLSDFRLGAWYTLIQEHDDNKVSHKYLTRCIQRDDL